MKDYQKAELKMMQEIINCFNDNLNFEKDNKILENHYRKFTIVQLYEFKIIHLLEKNIT